MRLRTLEMAETGCDIRDGILIECVDKDSVKIPAYVKRVAWDAFANHENVRIDCSWQELEKHISCAKDSIMESHDNWTEPYLEFVEYGPCMPVFGVDSDTIEEVIKGDWKTIVIDVDDVNDINSEIEATGRYNLITISDGVVSTPFDLPFLPYSPVRQIGWMCDVDAVNELIEKEGFGILFLKNLNENNYKNLPHNFIFGLTKTHSFCKVRLSPKWLVIIEVGPHVRLDAPGGTGIAAFNANYYKDVSVEDYMKRMDWDGKVITKNELWDTFLEAQKKKSEEHKENE